MLKFVQKECFTIFRECDVYNLYNRTEFNNEHRKLYRISVSLCHRSAGLPESGEICKNHLK
jgi:hypothetical protein